MKRLFCSLITAIPLTLLANQSIDLDQEARALRLNGDVIQRFNHPVESFCETQTAEGAYLFLTDDEMGIHQFRLTDKTAIAIRKINVNTEVKLCDVIDDFVYYLDANSGVWRFAVHEEAPDGSEPVWLIHGPLDDEHLSIKSIEDGIQIELMLDGRRINKIIDKPTPRIVYPTVKPALETQVVPDVGDIADDPAIWIHPKDPGLSLILGTDKARGLRVYDLAGNQRQELLVGRLNNVDIGSVGQKIIAAASNRTNKTIDLFLIDEQSGQLSTLISQDLQLDDPYGLCVATLNESLQIFVGGKDGTLEWWQYDGQKFLLLDTTYLPSQTEGCAMDYEHDRLFIGVEEEGIWSFKLEENQFQESAVIRSPMLTPDVEGLAVYKQWLVASSQGDDSYVLFNLGDLKAELKFRIASDSMQGIDGASETDGLEVTSQSLPGYPQGILVVQDGRNRLPDETQNFKIIDMRDVLSLLEQ